jgi:membrane-bound ClpP family serine protease
MVEFVVPFLLVVLALVLLALEDLLPSGGLLGVLAACSLASLLYLGFSDSPSKGFRYLAFEAVSIPVGIGAWWFLMAKTKLGRVAFLKPPEAHEVDASAERADLARLVGLTGRALTTLRPSGMVDFDGRRLEGVAEEGLIASGSPILAVRVDSGRLIVRPAAEEPSNEAG